MDDRILKLNGKWQFRQYPESARRMRDLDEGHWLDTDIPASIYTCLDSAGVIDINDLYANPENYSDISEKSWVFRKKFKAPQSLLDVDKATLVFEGLDTVTQIWLNDKLILKTENMFITHQVDVTKELQKDNTLVIKFIPAIAHGRRLMERYGKLIANPDDCPERSYIRKARYQFGSEYSPRLPGCGIFRDIYIKGITTAEIKDIHVRTIECSQHFADVKITVSLDKISVDSEIRCDMHIKGGIEDINEQMTFKHNQSDQTIVIRIERPFLWWPAGYGIPYLYQLETSLRSNDKLLQFDKRSFGIRTIKVDKSKYTRGSNFRFIVNDQPVYIKGAALVPPSMFPGRQDTDRLESLVNMAKDANINMLRISAGGYCPDRAFYELCDKLGIMIWQDFMFDSAYYPDRQWFLEIIHKEASSIITKLRNHPSVAIWCGNNKIDNMHKNGLLSKSKKFYGKDIYHRILPSLITECDPDREYIPSSVYGYPGKKKQEMPNQVCGLNVFRNTLPSRYYIIPKERIPEFITEFGLQSLPSMETISQMSAGNDISPGQLEKHNFTPDGNAKTAFYVSELFTLSDDICQQVYKSQVTQARAAKKLIEHLRAYNYINNGVILRQFNDCFPTVSHSAVDYNNNPKVLYYYLRRFFSPLLITLIDSDPGVQVKTVTDKQLKAVLINDLPGPVTSSLEIRLIDQEGMLIDKTAHPLSLMPFSTSLTVNLPRNFNPYSIPEGYLIYAGCDSNASNVFHLVPEKYSLKSDKKLEIIQQLKDGILTLSSRKLVTDLNVFHGTRMVECLDLLPGEIYKITIPGLSARHEGISFMHKDHQNI